MKKIIYLSLLFGILLIGCKTTTPTVEEYSDGVTSASEQRLREEILNQNQEEEAEPSPAQQQGPRQGQRTPEMEEEYQAMLTSLNLNEEQKYQFEIINTGYRDKMMKKRQELRDAGEGRETMRSEMQKIREEQDGALKNLLTEEQFKIYSEYVEKRRASRASSRPGRGF